MSVVAVQAGSGRLVASARPEEAVNALAAVEEASRDALREMRQLLGVLRSTSDDDVATREPSPGLAELDRVVERAASAGLDVAVRVDGDARPIPPLVDNSAFRIVQEALTNVLKHAPGAHVDVVVGFEPAAVVLDVRNGPGAGRPASGAGEGHGMLGMRERAALHGGDLSAAPMPDGGFAVRARLPVVPEGA